MVLLALESYSSIKCLLKVPILEKKTFHDPRNKMKYSDLGSISLVSPTSISIGIQIAWCSLSHMTMDTMSKGMAGNNVSTLCRLAG